MYQKLKDDNSDFIFASRYEEFSGSEDDTFLTKLEINFLQFF